MVMAATVLLQRQKLVKSASFQFKNSSRQKRIENMLLLLLMSGIWRQKVTGRSNLSSSSIPPSFPILFKKRTTAIVIHFYIVFPVEFVAAAAAASAWSSLQWIACHTSTCHFQWRIHRSQLYATKLAPFFSDADVILFQVVKYQVSIITLLLLHFLPVDVHFKANLKECIGIYKQNESAAFNLSSFWSYL